MNRRSAKKLLLLMDEYGWDHEGLDARPSHRTRLYESAAEMRRHVDFECDWCGCFPDLTGADEVQLSQQLTDLLTKVLLGGAGPRRRPYRAWVAQRDVAGLSKKMRFLVSDCYWWHVAVPLDHRLGRISDWLDRKSHYRSRLATRIEDFTDWMMCPPETREDGAA